MEKKYVLTNDVIQVGCMYNLHRIMAIRDFSDIKTGDLGGYVQSEKNLSHDGDCWIYDDARVYNDAQVLGNSIVRNGAIVRNSAVVKGNSQVHDHAIIRDSSNVESSIIFDDSMISGNATVKNSWIYHDVVVTGNAVVNTVTLRDRVRVTDNANISSTVYGIPIGGKLDFACDAYVCNDADYMAVEQGIVCTLYKQTTGQIGISWFGEHMSVSRFIDELSYQNSGLRQRCSIDKRDEQLLLKNIELAKLYFGVW